MRGYVTISAYHCSYQVMSLMTLSMGYHHGVDAVTLFISLFPADREEATCQKWSGVQPDHGDGCAFTSSLNSTGALPPGHCLRLSAQASGFVLDGIS